jgi:heme-degrading monooxygenase HmoA
MHVTVTYIRLRSPWQFFLLSYYAMKITLQLRTQPGFVKMKNTGFGRDHYTMSLWKTREDIKAFAKSGAHLVAMGKTHELSTDLKTLTYEADVLPAWPDAKARVR